MRDIADGFSEDKENGKVTLALVKVAVEQLGHKIDESDAVIRRQLAEQSDRQERQFMLRCVEVDKRHDDHEDRIRATEKEVIQLSTARKIGDGVSYGVTLFASSLAAAVGMMFNMPGGGSK
jgi:hypothetical protein